MSFDDGILTTVEARVLWKRNLRLIQDENLVLDRIANLVSNDGNAEVNNLQVNGELLVDGFITLTDLELSGNLLVGGNTTVVGNSVVGGNQTVNGTTTTTILNTPTANIVNGNLTNLTVTGSTHLIGTTVIDDLIIAGLDAPVDFQANGPACITLTNTTVPTNWQICSDVNQLNINSIGAIPANVVNLQPNGDVGVDRIKLRRGALASVKLDTDPLLSSNYGYNFPANAPTGNAQVIASLGSTNVFYDINAQNVLTVRKNPGPNEFASIAAAISAIPVFPDPQSPSLTNRYVVYVNAGEYIEPQIIIPNYVFIVGISMEAVQISPDGLGYPLITLQSRTGLAFVSIHSTDPAYPALYCLNCSNDIGADTDGYALVHKIELEGCDIGILCEADSNATQTSLCYFEYVGTTSCIQYSIKCSDTNILGGYGCDTSIENFFVYSMNQDAIIVEGLNSKLQSQATSLQSDGNGNAITVLNGGSIVVRGMYIENWNVGINVPSDANVPHVLVEGIIYDRCTTNINILNVNTTGYNDGYTAYAKSNYPIASPFFVANVDQHIITVAKKGADFTTVFAALNSITTNSPTDRYTIYIGPGIFVEPQLILKPYVALLGFFQTQSILVAHPSVAGTPFIIGAGYSAIDKLTLAVANYMAPPSYLIEYLGTPTGVHFRADNIVFDSSANYVHIGASAGPTIFLLLSALFNMAAPFTNGIVVDDGPVGANSIIMLVDNLIWSADAVGISNFNTLMEIESFVAPVMSPIPNIFYIVTNSSAGTGLATAGTGAKISGNVFATFETCLFAGFADGIIVENSAEPGAIIIATSTFQQNVNDITVLNPNEQGSINANASRNKVSIVSGAPIGVTLNDTNGSIVLSGDLYQGITWDKITNVSEQLQHAASTGKIDDQAELLDAGGLDISVSSGTGYVFIGPLNANYLLYVEWAAVAALPLVDNDLNWIYVDQSGVVLSSLARPDPISTIILGSVKTYSGAITYIQQIGRVINNLASNVDEILRIVFGPVVQSGCLALPGSSLTERAVQVTSGMYSLSVSQYPPNANDNVQMIGYYGGTNETAIFTNLPLQWDNAGILTAIPAGKWVKHNVYLLSALDGTVQYFMVFGQEVFNSELLANIGNNPIPPITFTGNMLPIAGIVLTDTDPASPLATSRFVDIRPRIGFTAAGSTTTSDHNSLSNLTVGNAHPQYFRVDGTSTMAGDIDLGNNNIIGTGGNLLNGVDLLAHASRHLPGGADALATATPITIGIVNSLGMAASFSRSDHLHAHGAQTDPSLHALVTITNAGFMSAADKIKIDTLVFPVSIANGGTNSSTSLNNNRIMVSNSGMITEASALLDGQLFIGFTGATPSAATLTAGTGITITNGAGSITISGAVGTVTSVGLSAPSEFVVSGSPVTTTGTLTLTKATQSANLVYAGPATGVAAMPTFRSLVVADIPDISSGLTGTLPAVNGGTGQSSYTVGDLLYASGATALSKLLSVATGNALISGGVATAPSWGKIGLTTHVTGILPIANGGTNSSTSLNNNRIMVSNSGMITEASALTNGQLLIGSTGATPSAAALTAGTGITITNGAGSITINGTLGTVTSVGLSAPSEFIVSGSPVTTTGTLTLTKATQSANLVYAGPAAGLAAMPTFRSLVVADIPNISSGLTGTLPAINGGTGQSSYTIGDLLYASGATALSKLLGVATGNALISGGVATAPSWGKIGLATHVTGILPIANGGTNSSTSLNNNRIMVSSGGAIVEAGALTNGQLLIGSTGATPSASTLTAGTGITITNGAGSITINGTLGTVTSVGLSAPSEFVVSGSPVTSSGTLTLTKATQSANLVYAGPSAGLAASPTFRSLVVADIPSISSGLIGTLPIVNGGTNSSTALNNNRVMVSSGGAIVEASALLNGQLLIGSTGTAPSPATLTAGSGITITNGAGSISIAANSLTIPQIITVSTAQLSIGTGAGTTFAFLPWSNTRFSSYTTRTVTLWVTPSSVVGKNLTVSVLPNGGPSIGSIVINGGAAIGALYSFTFTDPGVNTRLDFRASRTGVGGNNPLINGVTLEVS